MYAKYGGEIHKGDLHLANPDQAVLVVYDAAMAAHDRAVEEAAIACVALAAKL